MQKESPLFPHPKRPFFLQTIKIYSYRDILSLSYTVRKIEFSVSSSWKFIGTQEFLVICPANQQLGNHSHSPSLDRIQVYNFTKNSLAAHGTTDGGNIIQIYRDPHGTADYVVLWTRSSVLPGMSCLEFVELSSLQVLKAFSYKTRDLGVSLNRDFTTFYYQSRGNPLAGSAIYVWNRWTGVTREIPITEFMAEEWLKKVRGFMLPRLGTPQIAGAVR